MAAPLDQLVRTLSADGGIAVRAMTGTALVGNATSRHAVSPTACVAIGRALMGAVLLAAGKKHGDTVQLNFRGNGPLRSVTAIADSEGRVRGYASDPGAHPPTREGVLDVSGAVGRRGVLSVVCSHADGSAPYTGIVPLVAGTVAQDIASYLSLSEQVRAAIALGVYLSDDGGIQAAGGFYAEVLPGASEAEIAQVEANVRDAPGPGELVREGRDASDIVRRLLTGLGHRELSHGEPSFHCPCGRDRVLRTLFLLGRDELRRIAAAGETLEIRCEFCGEDYQVTGDEIGALSPDA